MPKRFERFGLSIHPERSRLGPFSRPFGRKGEGRGTFAFLGFDRYWGKTLDGGWTIQRKPQGKRLRRFRSGIHAWCHKNRPLDIVERNDPDLYAGTGSANYDLPERRQFYLPFVRDTGWVSHSCQSMSCNHAARKYCSKDSASTSGCSGVASSMSAK